ncbi:hypothetical protein EC988_001107 [Linderina pennispora]|nr:hypothetical protein EC988_001107 [Linderina pennispora]
MKTSKSKKSSGQLEEIGGYKVLPVHFADSDAPHFVYFKAHKPKKEDVLLPANRTLFMFNLPADATELSIRRLLKGTARVVQVLFHDVIGRDVIKTSALEARLTASLASDSKDEDTKPVMRTQLLGSGASAHVVVLEEQELANVLNMKSARREWPSGDPASDPLAYHGLSRYIYEYRAARPPIEMLKQDVDGYMAKFEEAQYERERLLAQQRNVPDADGFITVIRSGRKSTNTDGTITVTAATANGIKSAEAKKKDVQFGNMYRFQMRERKRDQLAELRKKFDEDKEKIARMRQNRHFRPY